MGHWPPLAYALAMGFNFTVMYLSAAVAFIVCGVMVWLFTVMQKNCWRPAHLKTPRAAVAIPPLLLFHLYIDVTPNSLYIIFLYLYQRTASSRETGRCDDGDAAGLEIPTMLIAGYFAKRLGKRFLMRVAAVGGVCFYAGMLMAHSPVILLGLQLLNAIFIGILGGIGMLYFQDLMPGQAGSATTLYTNTSRVGWIIAGSVAGIVAEIWNYHAVFWFAMVMIIATLFCLLRIKDV